MFLNKECLIVNYKQLNFAENKLKKVDRDAITALLLSCEVLQNPHLKGISGWQKMHTRIHKSQVRRITPSHLEIKINRGCKKKIKPERGATGHGTVHILKRIRYASAGMCYFQGFRHQFIKKRKARQYNFSFVLLKKINKQRKNEEKLSTYDTDVKQA